MKIRFALQNIDYPWWPFSRWCSCTWNAISNHPEANLGPFLAIIRKPSCTNLDHLDAFLGPFWAVLGLFWTILVQSWTILGPSGAILGPSMTILEHLEAFLGTTTRNHAKFNTRLAFLQLRHLQVLSWAILGAILTLLRGPRVPKKLKNHRFVKGFLKSKGSLLFWTFCTILGHLGQF